MDEEEEERERKRKLERVDLAPMSIEALGDFIGELEAEIARVRVDIAAKERARDAAANVFKS